MIQPARPFDLDHQPGYDPNTKLARRCCNTPGRGATWLAGDADRLYYSRTRSWEAAGLLLLVDRARGSGLYQGPSHYNIKQGGVARPSTREFSTRARRRGRAGGGVRPPAVAAVVHPAYLYVILGIPGQAGNDVREIAGAGGPDVLQDGLVGIHRLIGAGQDVAQVIDG